MDQKIKIHKLYLKYAWMWKTSSEMCCICQQEFNTVCQKCTHPINCVPSTGLCGHVFHLHCIEKWLVSTSKCPTCRSEWKNGKVFKESISK